MSKELDFEIKVDEIVEGNGSSLWGDSKGKYHVTMFQVHIGEFNSLTVLGDNLKWFQYTDQGIRKGVNKLKHLIEKEIGMNIERISWSEQGLQPQDGWNFDVELE